MNLLIKNVEVGQRVPLFYAPFMVQPELNYQAKCTFIGLNIFFYFMVEFHQSIKGIGRLCKVKLRRPSSEDYSLEDYELRQRIKWFSERLIHQYGENKNLDYHISARKMK